MKRLQMHETIGENTGDDAEPPLREDAAPSAEQAGDVARPNHRIRSLWKYGVTNQGERQRYTTQFLRQPQLRYVVQFSGTYSQCLVEEKRKLFEYPILPENLARPDSLKLVLTPGNLQMR